MKHIVALTIVSFGAYFLFATSPNTGLGALEKGPQPHSVHPREAALANFSISDIFKVTLPKPLTDRKMKVLFSGSELDEQRERFSNQENINEAALALNVVFPKFSEREEGGRMHAVDFLVQSLTQGDIPTYTIGAIAEVILSDSLYQTQDLDYRKSLVGDRVELYQALATTHPEVAQGIFQRAQGTSLVKVLRFAKGRADFNTQLAMKH